MTAIVNISMKEKHLMQIDEYCREQGYGRSGFLVSSALKRIKWEKRMRKKESELVGMEVDLNEREYELAMEKDDDPDSILSEASEAKKEFLRRMKNMKLKKVIKEDENKRGVKEDE